MGINIFWRDDRLVVSTHCRECGSFGSCSDYKSRYAAPLVARVWDHNDYVTVVDADNEYVADFPTLESANTFILMCEQLRGTRGAEL